MNSEPPKQPRHRWLKFSDTLAIVAGRACSCRHEHRAESSLVCTFSPVCRECTQGYYSSRSAPLSESERGHNPPRPFDMLSLVLC